MFLVESKTLLIRCFTIKFFATYSDGVDLVLYPGLAEKEYEVSNELSEFKLQFETEEGFVITETYNQAETLLLEEDGTVCEFVFILSYDFATYRFTQTLTIVKFEA